MSPRPSHTPATAVAGWMLAALMLGGCFFRTDLSHQTPPTAAPNDPAEKPSSRDFKPPATNPDAAIAGNDPAAVTRALLLRGGWYRVPQESEDWSPRAFPNTVSFHYRHEGVEQLLARPAAARNNLPDFMNDNDRLVAATAAIAIARLGDAKAVPRLTAAVENEQLPLPARAAAVEALGQLSGKAQTALLGRLADEYGQYIPGQATGFQADLAAELLRALARHVDPADDPRFVAAAEVPSSLVRIELLRAWAAGKRGALPTAIIDLRSDDDPRVRAAVLAALAARKPPDAFDDLTSALRDVDLSVRLAAIRGLGDLDDARAQAALGDVLKDRGELIRAAAVDALVARGSQAVVLGAASDPSWRVRLEVAKALAGYRNAEAASAARQMLKDANAEVERQVVRSVAAWPPESAMPVLLDALARDAVTVRKLAAEQVAARDHGDPQFPYEASPARRAQALAELRDRLQHEFAGISASSEVRGRAALPDVKQAANDEQVERFVAAGDYPALANLGPAVVASLERLAVERHLALPEPVYRDVLPQYSPAFAALDRLRGGTLDERRRAAEDLVGLAKKRSAGGLAVARLCSLVTTETDTTVWLRALDALGDDGSEPAARMARLALGQSAGEVRRRGCEFLAAHPDPAHEPFLAPCLEDSQQAVVVAALRALAAGGSVRDVAAIEKRLASPDEEVQLEAAVALLRLRNPAGNETIERLSYSGDMTTRGQLAQALGELGDIRYAAILIRLLDDSKATVSHAALASLPRVVGRDVAQSNDGAAASTSEKIARWKKWYAGSAP